MPYVGGDSGSRSWPSTAQATSRVKSKKTSINKTLSYGAAHDTLLEISKAASATESSSPDVSKVRVANTGLSPIMAIFKYQRWEDEDTVGAVSYMHFLLAPRESVVLPASRAIMSETAALYDGEILTDQAPDSNEYRDSGADVVLNELNYTTDPLVIEATHHELYRVGDLLRVDDEIMEVLGTYDDNPTTHTLADHHIVLKRGLYGSTTVVHSGTPDLRFPFFNAYHEWDKFSVAQTDEVGRFKAMNFFGYGRESTLLSGITPGSVAIQFYTQGYQKLGLSGITSNTQTGLTASTTYYMKIAVDGGSAKELTIITDSSNTKFGGNNGLVAKIQDALDEAYYEMASDGTPGALFEKKATCTIEDGDIVFRSGSKLTTSAISLSKGTSGSDTSTELFAQKIGRIPIDTALPSAVASRLEPTQEHDPITYSATYKNIFITDDANGNLIYNGRIIGNINYETGAVDWQIKSCPNAEFVINASYSSPLSGKQDATNAAKVNSLIAVYGNTPQQKGSGSVRVDTF